MHELRPCRTYRVSHLFADMTLIWEVSCNLETLGNLMPKQGGSQTSETHCKTWCSLPPPTASPIDLLRAGRNADNLIRAHSFVLHRECSVGGGA